MTRLDVGFVGAGTIARWHAERLVGLDQTLLAVADVDPDARRSFAEEYDVTATYDDYEAMLAGEALDVVVVAVPNALHAPCAIAGLEAGANVFVEKPLATSLADAERIRTAERDAEGTVMVGYSKRFDPAVENMLAHERDGEFGEVYEVVAEYVRQRGIPRLGSWFTRAEVAGGGVVFDLGTHVLHLALTALEFPEVETVSASTSARFGVDPESYTYLDMWAGDPVEDPTFDVEDSGRALIRTAEGATISLDCAWARNAPGRQRVQLLGDAGGATYDPDDGGLTVHSTAHGGLTDTEVRTPDEDQYGKEWAYFVEVLAGDRPHDRNTVEEGVAVQRVLDAVYRSADAHREVEPTPREEVLADDG